MLDYHILSQLTTGILDKVREPGPEPAERSRGEAVDQRAYGHSYHYQEKLSDYRADSTSLLESQFCKVRPFLA